MKPRRVTGAAWNPHKGLGGWQCIRKRNGSTQDTTTDTSIAGGLRGGIWAWHLTAALALDDVIFDPMTLPSPPTTHNPFGRRRGRRGGGRG
jgi:hypothetical protein